MSILTAIFIYFLIWWVMLFTVLPLGIERNDEDGKGYDRGAPKNPDLKRKLKLNTILSGIILAIIILLIEIGVIDWQGWFEGGLK